MLLLKQKEQQSILNYFNAKDKAIEKYTKESICTITLGKKILILQYKLLICLYLTHLSTKYLLWL